MIVHPAISVSKTASEQSKIGDDVTYVIEICNTGTVSVTRTSVDDSLMGDISGSFDATLAPGACSSATLTRTVVAGDPDPLVNTVTAVYSGIGEAATAKATADTDLFQPGVDVTKDCGPAQVQVGDNEICTIHVTNTSSADSPNLAQGTIKDTLTGDLLDPANTAVDSSDCTAVLATGADCTIVTHRTVLASDPSPLMNSVTVLYHPVGFPNNITDTATASVEIVTPAITVTKTASALSKIGDKVTYTIEICNSGPVSLTRTSVNDSLMGDIGGSFDATLAPGACSSATLTRTVVAGDADPLVNTVTATYSGVGQQAMAQASASTNLFQPGVDVTKSCSPDPITVGAVETCVIGISNTSSADSPNLSSGTIVDSLTGNLLAAGNPAVASSNCTATLAVGASCTITTTRTVLASDPSPLVNTVVVHYHPTGFPNDITDSASDSVVIETSGGQGCTPGFWKQSQHFQFWVGFSPNQSFSSVFGRTITISNGGKTTITNPTLVQALGANGGGINALARFSVNALLAGSSLQHPDFTTAQVVLLTQQAIDGGPAAIQAQHLAFAAAPGVVNDNCTGFVAGAKK